MVPLLDFECIESASKELKSSAADVEKEACFILGLLAIKNEHQQSIANAGAIAKLVALLSRHSVDLRPGYQNSKTEEETSRRGGTLSGAPAWPAALLTQSRILRTRTSR